MATTGTLAIKNGKIEYVKFGTGNKTIVILPGLSYDGFLDKAEEIEGAYKIFAKKYTVYLIDRNLTPNTNYSLIDIVGDTAEALSLLGVKKADFFGASLGGMVATRLAIEYPQLIGKLVLGSTLARPNDTFLNALIRWQTFAIKKETDKLNNDINESIYSSSTLKKYADFFAKKNTVESADKTARFIIYINAVKKVDNYELLDKITAKTMIIGALNDKITTAVGARETADKMHATYYEYKKYGHAVFDEAKGYKKLIYDFLTK